MLEGVEEAGRGAAHAVSVWVWRGQERKGASAGPPGEGLRAAIPAAVSGTRSLSCGQRRSQPGKIRGAAAPSSELPARAPHPASPGQAASTL